VCRVLRFTLYLSFGPFPGRLPPSGSFLSPAGILLGKGRHFPTCAELVLFPLHPEKNTYLFILPLEKLVKEISLPLSPPPLSFFQVSFFFELSSPVLFLPCLRLRDRLPGHISRSFCSFFESELFPSRGESSSCPFFRGLVRVIPLFRNSFFSFSKYFRATHHV